MSESEQTDEVLVVDPVKAAEAFANLKPKLDAIPKNEVVQYRASMRQVASNGLRMAKSYKEDREEIVVNFTERGFSDAKHGDVGLRALALWHADIAYRQLVDPNETLPQLLELGVPLRRKLIKTIKYLWEDDTVLGSIVDQIVEGRGHLDTADDLTACAALLLTHWEHAAENCNVTKAELDQAESIGTKISTLLGEVNSPAVLKAKEMQNRAATYFVEAGEAVYDAAEYVFRGDSQFKKRYPRPLFHPKRRRKKPEPKK